MTQAAARTDKILVVDDDARIRDLLRRYLTQEGFEVILAEDGKALNRLMLRETADLIVLDLMMPGEDGLSICRRLRAANDRTPIIMLTAKGEDVDRIVGLEVGADDYLGKPFNPRELLARDRKSTRLNSSHLVISYAVFCLKTKIDIYRSRQSLAQQTTISILCEPNISTSDNDEASLCSAQELPFTTQSTINTVCNPTPSFS